MSKNPKVFVLGLDGGTWNIFDHMMAKGIMPYFKKLKEASAWGWLNSTIPPMTCPAWLSFGTGKNPGQFGIYYFVIREEKSYNDLPFYFIRDVTGDNFWDILSNHGFKVGLINIPTVHKPYEINGFMICGHLTNYEDKKMNRLDLFSSGQKLIYPPELEPEIKEKIGDYYIGFPRADVESDGVISIAENIEDITMVASQRSKAISYLMENKPWDLIALDFMATDRMGHLMYKLISSDGSRYNSKVALEHREQIEGLYSKIDGMIKKFHTKAGKDAHFFIISDHGFGNNEGAFAVNDWLIANNYLTIKEHEKSKDGSSSTHVSPKMKLFKFISKFTNKFKLSHFIERIVIFLPKSLSNKIPDPLLKIDINKIDWRTTKAYYKHMGQIFLNVKGREPGGIVEPEDRDKLSKEIIKKLKREGNKYFGKDRFQVFETKKVYKGKYVDEAPEIIFYIDEYYYNFDTRVGHPEFFHEAGPSWFGGNHRQKGIFLFNHPDADIGKKENLEIIDLAPTILHIFNLKIPSDIDGKLLGTIFKKDSDFNKKIVTSGESLEKRRILSGIGKLSKKI